MSELQVYSSTSSVLLTLGVAFIGSFAGVSLCEQYRLAALSSAESKRYFVLFLVAVSTGWASVWCVFCLSMASMKLELDGAEIPMRFNRTMIIVAAFQSVLQTFISLAIGASDPCFNNTRQEIMDKFVAKASHTYTLKEIRNMSKFKLSFIVCTHSLERIIAGGVFAGIGVVITQYITTLSLSFQGSVQYNSGAVAGAAIFAVLFSALGFWVYFRVLSIYSSLEYVRLVLALVAVATVCGMHYIGESATTFYFDAGAAPASDHDTISQGELYAIAIASSVIFATIMLIFTLFDLRSWLLRTSTQLRQADKALHALMKRTAQLQAQLQHHQTLSAAAHSTASAAAKATHHPHALRRTPSEVLRYSRKFLSSKNLLDTAASSSATLDATSGKSALGTSTTGTAATEEVRLHSMFNDYEEEDDGSHSEDELEYSTAYHGASYGGSSAKGGEQNTGGSRKVSILRNNFGAEVHNLADLENQRPALTLSEKPKLPMLADANSYTHNSHVHRTVVPLETTTEGDVETTTHIFHA